MESFINTVNGIVWSPALVYLCLGAGLFLGNGGNGSDERFAAVVEAAAVLIEHYFFHNSNPRLSSKIWSSEKNITVLSLPVFCAFVKHNPAQFDRAIHFCYHKK